MGPAGGPVGRREFLRIGAAAGGGLLVTVSLPGCGRLLGDGAPPATHAFDAFVAVDTAGGVRVTIPVPDMGQGVRTSLAMLATEELEVPWERVRVEQADAADGLGPRPRAAGSRSVSAYWLPMRRAGAAAREALVEAAAARWGVETGGCRAVAGRVEHAASGRSLGYGEIAAEAAALPAAAEPALKDPGAFRIIGRPTPHLDAPAIVDGSAGFGIDVRVPGMLRAAVARAPSYGGTPRSWDDAAAREVPGFRAALAVDATGDPERPYTSAGVAAVADSTWAALRARDALRVEWDEGPNASESTESLHARCRALLDAPGSAWKEAGDVDAALAASPRTVEADYVVPFIVHAPLEPMNCVVHVREGSCEIWAPTQVPLSVRRAAASALDLPPERVTVHVTRIGGGFGRRLATDYVVEAVEVARQVDAPVQVVWSREDDMRHGFLRPMNHHRLRAGLDARGRPSVWLHRQAGTSRYAFRAGEHPGDSEFRPFMWPAAAAPAHRLEYAVADCNLWRGPLRAPGYNGMAFPTESFLDEVAHAAGRDPLELRLELLAGERSIPEDEEDVFETARLARVLGRAAEAAGWGRALPGGRGLGIAGGWAFGSYAAHVAEVSLDEGAGRVRVHRVFSAIDCGRAVNPNGVRAQVEGGIMDGLGAALHQEVTVERGRVVQSNFHDFPLLRLPDAPRVEVVVVESDAPPTGAGEPPYPPVAPAVANALFAAAGVRVRTLPMTPARVRAAMG